jgi:cytochrome c5
MMHRFHLLSRAAGFLALVGLLSLVSICQGEQKPTKSKKDNAGTTGFWEEFHRPPEPYEGPARSGEQVYAYRCETCHARGTQGAPIPGDEIQWGLRAEKGMDALMNHTINGFNQGLMPARGGCRNCSDAELRAAIIFMLDASSVTLEEDEPDTKPFEEFAS